jgi:hypothetical protein
MSWICSTQLKTVLSSIDIFLNPINYWFAQMRRMIRCVLKEKCSISCLSKKLKKSLALNLSCGSSEGICPDRSVPRITHRVWRRIQHCRVSWFRVSSIPFETLWSRNCQQYSNSFHPVSVTKLNRSTRWWSRTSTSAHNENLTMKSSEERKAGWQLIN